VSIFLSLSIYCGLGVRPEKRKCRKKRESHSSHTSDLGYLVFSNLWLSCIGIVILSLYGAYLKKSLLAFHLVMYLVISLVAET